MKQHYLMQFFKWEHLPTRLQTVSQPFAEVAKYCCLEDAGESFSGAQLALHHLSRWISRELPENPQSERAREKLAACSRALGDRGDEGLNLLLEAKDCAVRAALYVEPSAVTLRVEKAVDAPIEDAT